MTCLEAVALRTTAVLTHQWIPSSPWPSACQLKKRVSERRPRRRQRALKSVFTILFYTSCTSLVLFDFYASSCLFSPPVFSPIFLFASFLLRKRLERFHMQELPSSGPGSSVPSEHAARSTTLDEDEDEEALMQRALALSMQDSSSSTAVEFQSPDVRNIICSVLSVLYIRFRRTRN